MRRQKGEEEMWGGEEGDYDDEEIDVNVEKKGGGILVAVGETVIGIAQSAKELVIGGDHDQKE